MQDGGICLIILKDLINEIEMKDLKRIIFYTDYHSLKAWESEVKVVNVSGTKAVRGKS